MTIRIGHGFDVHAFGDVGSANEIKLGGVAVPFNRELMAHSDGDVVLHALCDALLGAAALGDIGQHFSDSDAQFKNIDSRHLLKRVVAMLQSKHLEVSNVDLTVIAQVPKLAGHIEPMCQVIAADLGVTVDCVNVKATTTEHLGYIGRQEGIAVHAVCLLHRL